MFLAKTARMHHPHATIALCILEKILPRPALECKLFDDVFLAADLGYENFDAYIFRHNLTEACTAIKAKLLSFLFERHPNEELVVFLDPDIWIFSPLNEIFLNSTFDVAVTPHHLEDETTLEATKDNVFRTLQCGVFNLGFLAIRRSEVAFDFLKWWDRKLRMFCYVDFSRGLFIDQKWIDLAISFFDLHILRHPGYNVANWNISKRILSYSGPELLVNREPLRFIHFSGIDSGRDLRIFHRYAPDPNAIIHKLRKEYKCHVKSMDQNSLAQESWSYDFYETGERIMLEARIACRNNPKLLVLYPRPFSEGNEAFNSIGW